MSKSFDPSTDPVNRKGNNKSPNNALNKSQIGAGSKLKDQDRSLILPSNLDASIISRDVSRIKHNVNSNAVFEKRVLHWRIKFKRSLYAVFAAVKLLKIHNKIKLFGTSTNMFKYEYRLKSSVQRSIFPTIELTEANSKLPFQKCLIHPDSVFLAVWQTLVLVCLIYIILFVPYSLVFDEIEGLSA